MNIRRLLWLLLCIAGAIGVSLILEFLRLPEDTHVWQDIHNAGHAPLAGIFAIAMLGISRILLGSRFKTPLRHYILAFVVTTVIGAISEIAQIPQQRDADIWDWVRDTAGAISFLLVFAAFDPVIRKWKPSIVRLRFPLILVAAIIVISTTIPAALWIVANAHRAEVVPKILTFESIWERKYVVLQSAELETVKAPHGFAGAEGKSVGELTMFPDSYPGMRIEEPFPDWSRYHYFRFEAYSEIDTTIHLALRIDDKWHNGAYEDRFNTTITIRPGPNKISIPLAKVKAAPVGRAMDMTEIFAIHLFTHGIADSVAIYVDNFRLQ